MAATALLTRCCATALVRYRAVIVKYVKGVQMADSIVARLFLSWCHTDQAAKESLIEPLLVNLRVLRGVEVRWWEDSHLGLGKDWHQQILACLAACDYGLLLLSPGFLASTFVTDHELPWFIGPGASRGVLPVGLKRVPLDGSRTLHGVDRHQIFTSEGRWFSETRGVGRERFVRDLATAVQRRILGDA